LWELTESEKELHSGIVLTPHCESRLSQMRSSIHRKGFLGVRQLLKKAGYAPHNLLYDIMGKPHLSDERFISISHSFKFVAVAISTQEVGIDLEKERAKIQIIAPKFLHPSECAQLSSDRTLTTSWCIKEAAYKLMGQKGLSFLNHIRIANCQSNHPITTVQTGAEFVKLKNWVYHWPNYSCALALKK
jgi:phosphopantetheinyl transferase